MDCTNLCSVKLFLLALLYLAMVVFTVYGGDEISSSHYVRIRTNAIISILTLLMIIIFRQGLYAEISGPTLSDLRFLYKTNYESLTMAMSGRSVGGVFGALVGGAVVDRHEEKSDFLLGAVTLLTGLTVLYIPFAVYVESTWYAYFVIGFAVCVMNILGTRVILKTWDERSSTILQVMLMVYGVGALLIPLICSPFLINTGNQGSRDDDVSLDVTHSNVHIPYALVSAYLFFVSIFFFVSYFWFGDTEKGSIEKHNHKEKTLTWIEYLNPATYAQGRFSIGLTVLVLLFIFYFSYSGCEKTFGNFIRTYSVDTFHLSKNQASYINTLFWCSYTVGRLMVSVLTRFMSSRVLLLIDAILHFGAVCLMKYFASQSLEIFYMLTFFEGFLLAPLYGLAISYGNTLMEIKGVCLTAIIISGNLGQWLYLTIAGTLYDTQGPISVIRLLWVPACVMMWSAVVMGIFKQRDYFSLQQREP